jgi:hypothetical protein
MGILLILGTAPDTVLWYRSVHVGGGSLLARHSELFGHPHQIGKRFCAHLLHDVGTMKLNRSLGGGEFAGSLFVELSSNNEGHHFPLSRRELLISLT